MNQNEIVKIISTPEYGPVIFKRNQTIEIPAGETLRILQNGEVLEMFDGPKTIKINKKFIKDLKLGFFQFKVPLVFVYSNAEKITYSFNFNDALNNTVFDMDQSKKYVRPKHVKFYGNIEVTKSAFVNPFKKYHLLGGSPINLPYPAEGTLVSTEDLYEAVRKGIRNTLDGFYDTYAALLCKDPANDGRNIDAHVMVEEKLRTELMKKFISSLETQIKLFIPQLGISVNEIKVNVVDNNSTTKILLKK